MNNSFLPELAQVGEESIGKLFNKYKAIKMFNT